MSQQTNLEAIWRLDEGPLDRESTVRRLFVAVGEIRPIEPDRYDLNRRDQWRDYDGRRLIVDVLTQRTQLVTIAESADVGDGGTLVVVGTGKQGRPPQVSVRWRSAWPPDPAILEDWKQGIDRAFAELPLTSFLLRVGDRTSETPTRSTVRIGASRRSEQISEIEARVEPEATFGGRGYLGAVVDDEVPPGWNRIWNDV